MKLEEGYRLHFPGLIWLSCILSTGSKTDLECKSFWPLLFLQQNSHGKLLTNTRVLFSTEFGCTRLKVRQLNWLSFSWESEGAPYHGDVCLGKAWDHIARQFRLGSPNPSQNHILDWCKNFPLDSTFLIFHTQQWPPGDQASNTGIAEKQIIS